MISCSHEFFYCKKITVHTEMSQAIPNLPSVRTSNVLPSSNARQHECKHWALSKLSNNSKCHIKKINPVSLVVLNFEKETERHYSIHFYMHLELSL
jgi:hypothetical protein